MNLVRETERIVRKRMTGQGAGHDVDHVLRVVRMAQRIQSEVGGDRQVIELAAWLHDVGDAKFHDGVERSGEFAHDILTELNASPETIAHVVHIVDNLSFRKMATAQPLSQEGQIVQDADRLDALGAVGIVRTIEYGATIGQPFHDPESPKSGVGHFHEKLFHLKALMNTEAGRRIAEERESMMKTFLQQYLHEVDGTA